MLQMRDKYLPLTSLLMQILLSQWSRYVVAWTPRRYSTRLRPLQTETTVLDWRRCNQKSIWTESLQRPRPISQGTSVLQSSLSTSSSSTLPNERARILHKHLESIGVDADGLFAATVNSLENPAAGYDNQFGKSAIRTYRAFVYPKKKADDEEQDLVVLSAAAGRCARQVDHLMKRYKSHQAEWVRHHDTIRDRRQVFPLVLVLDNLRSAFNVGSLYRTADACGCQLVITCGITPNPNGNGADKLAKSALGAEVLVPSKHFATTSEAIAYMREEMPEYNIVGMETTETAKIYTKVDFVGKKVALILGNEVTGVDTEVMSDIDDIVEIPTFGAKNSLNVASCAPVVLYEIIRQWDV